jgi:hypothetical protein
VIGGDLAEGGQGLGQLGSGGAHVLDVVELVQPYLDGLSEAGDAAAEDRQRHRGGAGRFDDIGAGRLFGYRDDHGAGEIGERVVGEVAPCCGEGDAHLRGHPLHAVVDEFRDRGAGGGHAKFV